MAEFEIIGTVVERGTRKGVRGVRVEAWDRDTRFHDMLGSAVTDGAGRFRLRFTDEYFGDYGGDRLPDVFYRVFRDDALVLSTQDHPTENVPGPRIVVTLEIDASVEPPADDDRIDAATAIKAAAFFQMSDFRGVGREAADQATLTGGFLGRMLVNGFKQWDWKPISPAAVRHSDVVDQDTHTAQTRLAAHNVTVERVEPYDPKLNRDSTRLLTALPARLEPGERVVLYQQDGRVKYYSRVRTEPAATIDQAKVASLSAEVAAVRADVSPLHQDVEELKVAATREQHETVKTLAELRGQVAEMDRLKATLVEVRAELAQRNQTIATLQAEIGAIKTAQDLIQRTDLIQRLDRLEAQVRR